MYAQAAYRHGRCSSTEKGLDERALAFLRVMMGERGEPGEQGFGPRGHRRHHGHGRGRGGFGDFGSFGWPPQRPGGRFGRGRKARRGDIRTAALLLLAEEPRNGYQIMQEVEQRSEGVWRPSPGSVYPALQQLEDEGLIRSEESEGRKLFHLSEAGEAEVRRRDEGAPAPWEEMNSDFGEKAHELGQAARSLMVAFAQVMRTLDEQQLEQARLVLLNARRELYRILAEADGQGSSASKQSDPNPDEQ
jgi:DNA-binding PadR family transcriptional regulator